MVSIRKIFQLFGLFIFTMPIVAMEGVNPLIEQFDTLSSNSYRVFISQLGGPESNNRQKFLNFLGDYFRDKRGKALSQLNKKWNIHVTLSDIDQKLAAFQSDGSVLITIPKETSIADKERMQSLIRDFLPCHTIEVKEVDESEILSFLNPTLEHIGFAAALIKNNTYNLYITRDFLKLSHNDQMVITSHEFQHLMNKHTLIEEALVDAFHEKYEEERQIGTSKFKAIDLNKLLEFLKSKEFGDIKDIAEREADTCACFAFKDYARSIGLLEKQKETCSNPDDLKCLEQRQNLIKKICGILNEYDSLP